MVHWRSKIEKYKRDGVAARSLKPFREYIICPHKTEALSEIGRVIYWRFSCAGLVIDCYEAAGIASVEVDAEMPEVDDAILQEAYPDIWKLEQAYQQNPDAIARRYGYEGLQDLGLDEKPWRPILPGYVFHALARADSGNPRPGPYTPSSAEERYFP
ncbi:MAG: hypothetical protein DWQ31_14790 [Planctomycetota bacterium]|nr:MAG: hypothetical protein DWQ31_14790 [Planctomycetota bacterium]